MFRIRTNRSNRSAPPVYRAPNSQSVECKQTESKKTSRWHTDAFAATYRDAFAATYRYVSEGVRILGDGYSTYDDRSPR
jgi:hypothetical protein